MNKRNEMMKTIGITGGVGAGKSKILAYIQTHCNCRILLADEAAHKVREPGNPCYNALVRLLGTDTLEEDGQINRQKMAAALDFPLERAVACQQVHSTHVAVVTERDAGKGTLTLADAIPETDGMVTDCHRLPLLISYADCVPILLADTRTGAVGAVHGGWRGSVGKIVPHALNVMKEAFGTEPGDVVAGIGPSIGPCCYEVGQEVADRAAEYPSCLTPHGPGHYMLDLWQLNTLELLEAGVPREQIYRADSCTSCHKDRFFSYRAEKGKTGRLYAVIYRK